MAQQTSIRTSLQLGIYKVIDPFVKVLIRLGLTPNAVTTIGFILNAGVWLLIYFIPLFGVFGGICWLIFKLSKSLIKQLCKSGCLDWMKDKSPRKELPELDEFRKKEP